MPSSVASGVDTLAVMDTMPLASSTSPSRRNTDVSPRLSRVTRTRLSMYSTSNQPRPNGGSHRFLSAHRQYMVLASYHLPVHVHFAHLP